ncbi:MAG: type II secretion system F family protein, partial [bacterium]|nr:type II secretion system F family protein [bacterium]
MRNNSPGFFSKLFDRLSVQDRINFARHLSLVIRAGLPVFEGLKIIQAQTESAVLKKVIESLMDDVNNGKFLADGLQRFEHLFGIFFINIVRVGESSGTLSKNLLYLADELRREKSLQSKVRSAMIYPLVILIATIGVAGFLTFYVFPKLVPVFATLNVQLPITTRILLATLNFLRGYGVMLLGGIVVTLILAKIIFKKVTPVRYFFHQLLFFIPVVADLTVSVNMVNFARVLGLLLKSGVKIVESIDITRNTFSNLVYKRVLTKASEEIRKGSQLGVYLARSKRIFPPLVSGMVRIGEGTGNLEENLEYLADYYDDEV